MTELNEPISREEIIVAVERAKLRKAAGFDEIPAEVLKNQTAIDLLFIICNGCFELGRVSDQWTKGRINPIDKSGSDSRNNPLNYRGIALIYAYLPTLPIYAVDYRFLICSTAYRF